MTRAGARRRPVPLAAATAAVATGALALAVPDRPALALAPLAVVAAAWALARAPLRVSLLVLLFLALAVPNPQERPFDGLWDSPLQPLGTLLFVNLRQYVGVDALRFSVIDVALVALLGLHAYRRATGRFVEERGAHPGASCVPPVLLVAFLGVLAAEAWGIGRGGDFRNSLWQVRQLFFVPILAYLFLVGLRGPRDLRSIAAIIVAGATVKALVGLAFYALVVLPRGLEAHYLTSHTDSPLYVGALVVCVVHWYHARSTASRLLVAAVGPLMLTVIALNERRLAHLELVAALGTLYLLAPPDRLKRSIRHLAVLGLPLLAAYLAVGWNAPGAAFAPVRAIRSIFADTDSSAVARRIENGNLVVTIRAHMPLGSGFGQEYIEQTRGDSIAEFFEQYRFIPHNAVLGLFAFAGLAGFALIWSPLVLTVFLGARALRFARRPAERAAAQVGIALVVAHAIQAWGDMGLTSWDGAFLFALAAGGMGKLAVAVGAWPAAQPTSADGKMTAAEVAP